MRTIERLEVRPYQFLCLVCRIGEGATESMGNRRLDAILRVVRENPNVPVTLRANVDSVYRYQNPGRAEDTPEGELFNDKRDLDVIQKLGLVPGETRPALELFHRLFEKIPTVRGLCGFERVTAEAWRGCPRAFSGHYEAGHARGISAVIPRRAPDEKARFKTTSAQEVYETRPLRIRPHHLMCMACFHGGRDKIAPIAEDNLFEAIDVIQKDPNVPVTLVPGCCMICPPCSKYDPATNLCVGGNGMGLRDQKKDLDVLQRLGLTYDVTLPARELYSRLFQAIHSTRQICGYDDGIVRGWEWTICGGPDGSPSYQKARACGMGFLAPAPANESSGTTPPEKKTPEKST
jgi:hypothetical protein